MKIVVMCKHQYDAIVFDMPEDSGPHSPEFVDIVQDFLDNLGITADDVLVTNILDDATIGEISPAFAWKE